MLRVLVIDSSPQRGGEICAGLAMAGHQVAAVLPSVLDLAARVAEIRPDVILIQSDAPSRDTLEHLAIMNREYPRPVLFFSQERGSDAIRRAMRAGVSTYVVDSVEAGKLDSLMEVAVASFEEYQALRQERDEASRKLSERVVIDKAKGLLMKARGVDEDAAYHALRKLA
ncbi:MAG: ANTAR domain-containing protein, partial [Zoogloea sp.]|nr:ANTAR domain-containing protein [Zoogloea sp.]